MKPHYSTINKIVLLALLLCSQLIFARDGNDPVLVDESYNLYKAGNIYLSGQPSKEQLKSLADKNVSVIINIRTEQEMQELAESDYDEKSFVEKDLNLPYIHVPMGGSAGYSEDMTREIAKAISQAEGDVLIHCRSAGRATLVWMAWLVNYNKTNINDAFRMGKTARFSFPIEDLLGAEIKMKNPKK